MTLEEMKRKHPVDEKMMARERRKLDAYLVRYERNEERKEKWVSFWRMQWLKDWRPEIFESGAFQRPALG